MSYYLCIFVVSDLALIGFNVARNAALWAGCPVTTSGATINRFCSSGLQAVANAAHSIIHDQVKQNSCLCISMVLIHQLTGELCHRRRC